MFAICYKLVKFFYFTYARTETMATTTRRGNKAIWISKRTLIILLLYFGMNERTRVHNIHERDLMSPIGRAKQLEQTAHSLCHSQHPIYYITILLERW